MNDAPSRDEIAARLETAEARTEARFAQLTGSMDVRFASLEHKIDRLADTVTGLIGSVQEVKQDLKDVRQEVKAEASLTRKTMIAVAVGGILAGLAALWGTQANLLSAFEAGLAAQALHATAMPAK
jgi:hypothetical protein